jgi:hypothetical protein
MDYSSLVLFVTGTFFVGWTIGLAVRAITDEINPTRKNL